MVAMFQNLRLKIIYPCIYNNFFKVNNKICTNNISKISPHNSLNFHSLWPLKNSLLIIRSPLIRKQFFSLNVSQHSKFNNGKNSPHIRLRSTLYYMSAVGILIVGLSYAAVPMYRLFCQAYSYGGAVNIDEGGEQLEKMEKRKDRIIKIRFNADTASAMTWNFKPEQRVIKVAPGETALAFYTAKNPTNRPVIGVSTYNVLPYEAGQYFNKIQCFCFEEQMLNPNEEVHMPVFFYIDPEFAEDPKFETCDEIILSYTFFEVKEGFQLPVPIFHGGK